MLMMPALIRPRFLAILKHKWFVNFGDFSLPLHRQHHEGIDRITDQHSLINLLPADAMVVTSFRDGQGLIAVGFGHFEVGAQPATLKDRERHLWGEVPDTTRPGHEEIRQAGAGGTGKSYAGEK